jgi:hypothetical protein
VACSEEITGGSACPDSQPAAHEALALSFLVSKDEEYVRLYAIRGRLAFDLGERAHNYLLLTLARRRLADEVSGVPASQGGWLDLSELAHDPSMAGSRLNLDVFRIRQQFAARGLAHHGIVERRATTRQIRVSINRITITRV